MLEVINNLKDSIQPADKPMRDRWMRFAASHSITLKENPLRYWASRVMFLALVEFKIITTQDAADMLARRLNEDYNS